MAKILVVDDSPEFLDVVKDILDHVGHEVFCALNASQALSTLESQNIDLLITDMVMPDHESSEFITEIKLKEPKLPLIVVSGYPNYLREADLLKVDKIISKPFKMNEIIDTVTELLN